MSTTQSLNSLGHLSVQLLRSIGTLRRAIDELKLEPALLLNGLPYYDDDQAELIRAHLERSPRRSPAA